MQTFKVYLTDMAPGNLDGVILGPQDGTANDSTASDGTAAADGTQLQTGTGVAYTQPTLMESILPMIIMVPLMIGLYWLMTRGQRKREKAMKEMQASIKTGDNVLTAGGFFGRVVSVGEDCYNVEFGTNRSIHIPVLKTDILGIRAPKMTPAPKEIESK